MKSIAIYNNKGGCGKSTSVINLAYQFSIDSKVLVIDTDGQSNTSRFFVKQPNDGLEKVLTGKGKMPRAEKTRYAYLDVISATAALNNAALIFGGFSEKKQSEIADKIITSNSDYDYVIVDLPPAMNVMTEHIIGACDYVFVPIELGSFSIQGLPRVTDLIQNSKVLKNSKVQLGGVFINKFDRKNGSDIALFKSFNELLSDGALNTIIPYSKVIKNSIIYNCTAQEYMGWTNAGRAFRELAAEIRERIGE